MKKYINRFWGIGFLAVVFVTIIVFFAFKNFDIHLEEDISVNLSLKNEYIAASIDAELLNKAKIVENISTYIDLDERFEEEHLLRYLKAILAETENLESIYFGSVNNHMINGSGWQPPDDFDLRTRPWYIKAKTEKTLVMTDVFLNASKDKEIITISKPVFDQNKTLLGVVGADLSIEKIIELIEEQNEDSGYTFLLNGEGRLVASSDGLEDMTQELSQIEFEILDNSKNDDTEIIPISVGDDLGYVLLRRIENTDLILGSFVSKDSYFAYQKQLQKGVLLTFIPLIVIFAIMFILQRRILLQPLYCLDQDIKRINIMKDVFYRLPVEMKDPFYIIRQSVNKALKETEHFFTELQYNQEELEASNEELTASMSQLQAYEEELHKQHDMLLESKMLLETSEKRNRAIVSVLPDILFVYDSKGTFIDCQTNDKSNLLVSKDMFIGKTLFDVMPTDIANKATECIKETLDTEDVKYFEYQLEVDHQIKSFETRMVKNSEDQVLAIVRDITLEKQEQDFILELSYKDHLTGLYNRRYFDEKLLKLDHMDYLPLSIIMVDVNGLKLTNDAFGHFAGDELLKKVAQTLDLNCTEKGFVSRVGGDEFVMVCLNTDKKRTEALVEKVYEDISHEKIDTIIISISAGWEVRETLHQSIRDTFIKAENHMFRKKIVESQSMRNKTIQVIMETLNEKSEREKRHSVQVSEWSKRIGEAMALNPQLIKEIETAGLVHDIGKIAVREEVLNKPGKLTDEEYDEIKKHSESGYQILKSVDAYSSLADDVLAHHERYDGYGYPRGLEGEEIPLIARIICIADAYEAMISDRSYRKGMPHEDALAEIIRCSGSQFDPVITEVFVKLFDQDKED